MLTITTNSINSIDDPKKKSNDTDSSNTVAAKDASTNIVLNPSDIKVEAKEDSEEKLSCYSPSAPGGVQLPLHAINAKHSVRFLSMLNHGHVECQQNGLNNT